MLILLKEKKELDLFIIFFFSTSNYRLKKGWKTCGFAQLVQLKDFDSERVGLVNWESYVFYIRTLKVY